MSYEKVKLITRKEKENKIFVTSASSNVYPKTYYKWEYMKNYENMSYEEKMYQLLRDISGGNLQLNDSMYNWQYAILRAREDIGKDYSLYDRTSAKYTIYVVCDNEETKNRLENYYNVNTTIFYNRYVVVDTITSDMILLHEFKDYKEYYKQNEKDTDDARINKEFKEYYNTFIKYLDEKIEGEYYLYSKDYGYIKNKGTNGSFYYNIPFTKDLLMDYKKAYCLQANMGKNRNVEIKKLVKREIKASKEQVDEGNKRLDMLGLENLKGKELQMSTKTYFGAINKDVDMEIIEKINDFEKEYNSYVYYVIKTNSYEIGTMYAFLYVSNYKEEWEDDRIMLLHNECYSYVYNKDNECCSEIGLIGFEGNGVLIRTF